jgi:uncharacterized protein (DUF427 family)
MDEQLVAPESVLAARACWQHRGERRPAFAESPGPGQESVWDFPRPPRIEAVPEAVRVLSGGARIAASDRCVRVLETAGAPTYYLPPEDVDFSHLEREGEASLCEWKGVATTFTVAGHVAAAWCYERTFPEFAAIRSWMAFYPNVLECYVGEERVLPQPGGYYGGWVRANLVGPIKGEPGSGAW